MAEKNYIRKWWLEMHCDDDGTCYDSIYAKKPPDMNQVREFARKKSIEFAIKRYFQGVKNGRDRRYFYNDGKKLIPEKEYHTLVAQNKAKLGNTLSSLLRKGDRITIPLEYLKEHS